MNKRKILMLGILLCCLMASLVIAFEVVIKDTVSTFNITNSTLMTIQDSGTNISYFHVNTTYVYAGTLYQLGIPVNSLFVSVSWTNITYDAEAYKPANFTADYSNAGYYTITNLSRANSSNISVSNGIITLNMTCEQITGGSGLCDGTDADTPDTTIGNCSGEGSCSLLQYLTGSYLTGNFSEDYYAINDRYTVTNFTVNLGTANSSNISISNGIITLNMTCEQITGGSGLCDGTDSTGTGSGNCSGTGSCTNITYDIDLDNGTILRSEVNDSYIKSFDSNASTACDDNEVLLGDGICYDLGNIQNSTRNRTGNVIYAQLSDLNDQPFAATGTPQPLNFSTEDEIYGLTHSTTVNSSEITIVTSASYTIIAQPQVSTGTGGAGTFHMWVEKYDTANWINVSNSNVELVLGNNEQNVIPLVATLRLNPDERVRIMGSVSDTNIKLDAQTPSGEPVIPSIIFSMFEVGGTNLSYIGNCSGEGSCGLLQYRTGIYTVTNFTANYYDLADRYTITNFTANYYALNDRYTVTNFTTDYYALGDRYKKANLTIDYPNLDVDNTTDLMNGTDANFPLLNVTTNLTIHASNIWWNGSGICIGSC